MYLNSLHPYILKYASFGGLSAHIPLQSQSSADKRSSKISAYSPVPSPEVFLYNSLRANIAQRTKLKQQAMLPIQDWQPLADDDLANLDLTNYA